MPWIEPEDRVDREFIEFVKQYKDQSRPKAKGLFRVYSDKGIAVFHAVVRQMIFKKPVLM